MFILPFDLLDQNTQADITYHCLSWRLRIQQIMPIEQTELLLCSVQAIVEVLPRARSRVLTLDFVCPGSGQLTTSKPATTVGR